MTRPKLLPLCGCLLLALASCANDDYMSPDVQYDSAESSAGFSQLRNILNKSQIISDETTQEDAYILFDSSDGTFNVLTEDDYLLCSSIADFLSNDKKSYMAPECNGWRDGGTYKNKVDGVYQAVTELIKEIPAKQFFELHIENNDNGAITIWWRPV